MSKSAIQAFGRKFDKMPESYQDRMTEKFGEFAEQEHVLRGEAQIRAREGERANYKVKNNNFNEFINRGDHRLDGAGGAARKIINKKGERVYGKGKPTVSSYDFANLYKANLKENATKADKMALRQDLIDWGKEITPKYEKANRIGKPIEAGYGDKAQARLDNWQARIDKFNAKKDGKAEGKKNNTPQAKPDAQPQTINPGGGSTGQAGRSPNIGANYANPQTVSGTNNTVSMDNSITQNTDNRVVYEGDDRNFTKIVNSTNYSNNSNNSSKDNNSTNIYAPRAETSTDYSDATMAGFFKPSDSPAASQKFLAKYMEGLKGSADDYSDAMYNMKRNYADNLAMIDYETANARMNQIKDNFYDRAALNRLESQPSAEAAFEGLKMATLPKKIKDETKEIYESFG